MLIMIDEAIPGGPEVFDDLGRVRTFSGRSVRPKDLVDADALIVRSVTRVDAALLADSRVRFVGTATTGTDHVDTAWLDSHGITHASAAGCNALPVSEYVLAAVLLLTERRGLDPTKQTLGVIGVGRIGSRVARWARAMGMAVLQCDPPLQRQTGASPRGTTANSPGRKPWVQGHRATQGPGGATNGTAFVDAAELLHHSDIVTLHVPLTSSGLDPTRDMVGREWLSNLKAGAILINTSRGEVVREAPLLAAIESERLGGTVLDVWRNEPDIAADLVRRTDIATPHIAGYSAEARRRAVEMIHHALAGFATSRRQTEAQSATSSGTPSCREAVPERGTEAAGPVRIRIDEPRSTRTTPDTPMRDWWHDVAWVVRQSCDLASVDRALRDAVAGSRAAERFDEIRRTCSSRIEFGSHCIDVDAPARTGAAFRFLAEIGFRFASSG